MVNNSKSRLSSDGQSTILSTSLLGSRTSVDRTRTKDSQKTHRKSESVKSEGSKVFEDDSPEVSNSARLTDISDL